MTKVHLDQRDGRLNHPSVKSHSNDACPRLCWWKGTELAGDGPCFQKHHTIMEIPAGKPALLTMVSMAMPSVQEKNKNILVQPKWEGKERGACFALFLGEFKLKSWLAHSDAFKHNLWLMKPHKKNSTEPSPSLALHNYHGSLPNFFSKVPHVTCTISAVQKINLSGISLRQPREYMDTSAE